MIPTLYVPFRHWSDGGSVYILSDLHFDDADCSRYVNLAVNVCGHKPLNLGTLIKSGVPANIPSIHRVTIDQAALDKKMRDLPLNIVYSKRKNLSIELGMDALVVRAPEGMHRCEINAFLQAKSAWIEKHWKKIQERKAALDQLPPFSMDEIRELADQARAVIPEKVKKYAAMVGVTYGKITIRNQRSRWGSCSSKGNLNFNCLLMLFPEEVVDYVVVHELCHRKKMNHSAEFYAEVERVFPNYRSCQRWLKENGGAYLARLR